MYVLLCTTRADTTMYNNILSVYVYIYVYETRQYDDDDQNRAWEKKYKKEKIQLFLFGPEMKNKDVHASECTLYARVCIYIIYPVKFTYVRIVGDWVRGEGLYCYLSARGSVCVCMSVFEYVCISMWVYIWVCVYMYIRMCVYARICEYVWYNVFWEEREVHRITLSTTRSIHARLWLYYNIYKLYVYRVSHEDFPVEIFPK